MTTTLQTPVQFLNVCAAVSGLTAQEQAAFAQGIAAPEAVVNLDGVGLHIAWDVTRSRSSKTDDGTVTIKNLSQAFRRDAYAAWQNASGSYRVGVHIGWGSEVHLVMAGDCWEFQPEVRAGEDILTVLRFGEGQRPITESTIDTPKQYAFEAGQATVLWLVVQDMFNQLGLKIDPSMQAPFAQAVTATPLAAGGSWVFTGELTSNLNDILDTFGLEWKVINAQVIFLRRGVTASSQAPVAVLLNADTGLLDWKLADGGVECLALAQPAMVPGTQIVVQDAFGAPVGAPGFRVETVRFTGQTDGESLMTLVGRRSVVI